MAVTSRRSCASRMSMPYCGAVSGKTTLTTSGATAVAAAPFPPAPGWSVVTPTSGQRLRPRPPPSSAAVNTIRWAVTATYRGSSFGNRSLVISLARFVWKLAQYGPSRYGSMPGNGLAIAAPPGPAALYRRGAAGANGRLRHDRRPDVRPLRRRRQVEGQAAVPGVPGERPGVVERRAVPVAEALEERLPRLADARRGLQQVDDVLGRQHAL